MTVDLERMQLQTYEVSDFRNTNNTYKQDQDLFVLR